MHVNAKRPGARLALLGTRTWRYWAIAATLARLPGNMAPLALIVILPGSRGAIAAACYTVGIGAGATWRGRAIDRSGIRRGLRREGLLLAGSSLLVFAAIASGAPDPFIGGAAMIMGITGSAVGVAYRAALPTFVPRNEQSSAYTVDAVLTELSFVASPLIIAVLAATAPPDTQFLVTAACAAASCLVGVALPSAAPHPASATAESRGWISGGAPVFAITAVIGFGYGLLMAGLPARLSELGWSRGTAASLFAVMSGSSAVCGIAIAFLGLPTARLRNVAVISIPFAAATAVLATVSVPGAAIGGMAIFGLALAPLNGLGSKALSDRVPPGTLARAFAVFAAMITINSGLGFGLAAVLLDIGGGQVVLAASQATFLILTISLFALDIRRHGTTTRCEPTRSGQPR